MVTPRVSRGRQWAAMTVLALVSATVLGAGLGLVTTGLTLLSILGMATGTAGLIAASLWFLALHGDPGAEP